MTERRERRRDAGPGRRAQPSANPRRVALDVLDRVLGRGWALDDAFAGHPALAGLEFRDRAFARLLVATTLRRLGQLDDLLAGFVKRRPERVRTQNLLRLGAAQLLFLGTPPHAAVGETVALATRELRPVAGLANAVLRRLVQEGPDRLGQQDPARLNTPAWLWDSWIAAYGEPTARRIAEAHLTEPPLDLRAKADPAPWAERLGAELLPNGTLRRREGGAVDALPGYAEGAWWVQDAAAALPAMLLGDVAGREILDLCAAPGGKAAQLAAAGGKVTAAELSALRALRLRENLERLKLEARVEVADVREWRPERPAGLILLDAPCTSTGTIRRHPDIPWRKTPEDVARMAELQAQLLVAAVEMLAPGGRLVYASCSLQVEEGPAQIEGLLAGGAPVERDPILPDELAGLPVEPTPQGEARTLPCHFGDRGGLDGFFMARLRRRA